MNDNTYSYVDAQDVEVIMHQILSENESHIAKSSESENTSELCDSTQCEIDSINKKNVRDTPHKKSELHFKTCEDAYNSNPLISISSVVSQNVKVCKKNEEEIAAHNSVILDKASEKVVTGDDQFNA